MQVGAGVQEVDAATIVNMVARLSIAEAVEAQMEGGAVRAGEEGSGDEVGAGGAAGAAGGDDVEERPDLVEGESSAAVGVEKAEEFEVAEVRGVALLHHEGPQLLDINLAISIAVQRTEELHCLTLHFCPRYFVLQPRYLPQFLHLRF